MSIYNISQKFRNEVEISAIGSVPIVDDSSFDSDAWNKFQILLKRNINRGDTYNDTISFRMSLSMIL